MGESWVTNPLVVSTSLLFFLLKWSVAGSSRCVSQSADLSVYICTHAHIVILYVLLFRFFAVIGRYKTVRASVLCSRPLLSICRVCRSVWLLTPNAQFIPPSPFPRWPCLLSLSDIFTALFGEETGRVCRHWPLCVRRARGCWLRACAWGARPGPLSPSRPDEARRGPHVSAGWRASQRSLTSARRKDRTGNGNPLQAAGLQNPSDRRGACRATGRGAAQRRTRLSAWAQRRALESPRLLKARALGSPPRFPSKSGVSLRTCIFNTFPGRCWWPRVMLWKLLLSRSGPPPHTHTGRNVHVTGEFWRSDTHLKKTATLNTKSCQDLYVKFSYPPPSLSIKSQFCR